jgi:tripeptidyl-peptidase I
VADTFAAADETIDSVLSWLADYGIDEGRVVISKGRNLLRLDVTVAEAESLLKTDYKVYNHKQTGKRSLACDEYSVPAVVQRHIDYITPTVHSSLAEANAVSQINVASSRMKPSIKQNPPIMNAYDGAYPSRPNLVSPHASRNAIPTSNSVNPYAWNLTNCPSYMTPACIRHLYNMPNGTLDRYVSRIVRKKGI